MSEIILSQKLANILKKICTLNSQQQISKNSKYVFFQQDFSRIMLTTLEYIKRISKNLSETDCKINSIWLHKK